MCKFYLMRMISFYLISLILVAVGCSDSASKQNATNAPVNLNSSKALSPKKKVVSDKLYDEFFTAIVQRNTNYIDTFLKLNPELNRVNSLGETPLTLAATLGDFELIVQLIESGANINYPNRFGRTALHKAIIHFEKEGAKQIVLFLIKSGAKVDTLDKYNAPPIYYCFFNLAKPYLDAGIAATNLVMIANLEEKGASRSAGLSIDGLDKERLTRKANDLLGLRSHTLSSNQVELLKAIVKDANPS